MIRRILDYFGLAKYPELPNMNDVMERGVNAHVTDEFARIKEMGFTCVRLDPVGDVPTMLDAARKAGIKSMISGTKGQDLEVVFRYWKPDYVCVANEPDQDKFWPGSTADLVEQLVRAMFCRDIWQSDAKLIFPCASGLSRGKGRKGTKELIRFVSNWAGGADILIGQHLYEKTPDAMMRKLDNWIKFYRKQGWKQKFFITEFGFRDDIGESKQATYLVNTLSMLSKHPEVAGACVYAWKDDPPENFGIVRATGLAKRAALRLYSSTVGR